MNSTPVVAVVTVTYNAAQFIEPFLESLYAADSANLELTVVVVDNGSTDGTVELIRNSYPSLTLLQNDENNYTRALNLAIENSQSDFVAITNNDASVHKDWLQGFMPVFSANPRAGAVQSKILFAGRDSLNSVGVEEVGHFYFKDIAFDRKDSKRYSQAARRDYITGGSMMLRRSCLEDVGPWDEEFIMFMEDVDYSQRCRAKGWELWFAPESILHHQYHGSTSREICDYFCTRNRFLFVAKHFPGELVASIAGSEFYKNGEYDLLYRSLLHAVRKMVTYHSMDTVEAVLKDLSLCLPGYIGDVSAYAFFSQLELVLGLRKIRAGIYVLTDSLSNAMRDDVLQLTAMMQGRYDVTCIFNSEEQLVQYRDRHAKEVGSSDLRVLPALACDPKEGGKAAVKCETPELFDTLARDSLEYDIFINASMLAKVKPLASIAWFLCDGTDQRSGASSNIDNYDHLIGPDSTAQQLQTLLDQAEAELIGRDLLPTKGRVA